jgi:hypothetical protein
LLRHSSSVPFAPSDPARPVSHLYFLVFQLLQLSISTICTISSSKTSVTFSLLVFQSPSATPNSTLHRQIQQDQCLLYFLVFQLDHQFH